MPHFAARLSASFCSSGPVGRPVHTICRNFAYVSRWFLFAVIVDYYQDGR